MRQFYSIEETTVISYYGTKVIVGRFRLKETYRDELEKILTKYRELFSCKCYDVGEDQYEESN